MDVNRLILYIDVAFSATTNVVDNSSYLTFEHPQIAKTLQILDLLKNAVKENPEQIKERILRGAHDLGMYSFKYFENTPLEEALCKVTQFLYEEIPRYKKLEPLGLDFGEGDPI